MEDRGDLERLTAGLALRGISRASAAETMHLSVSQLNKKLRGKARLFPQEREALEKLSGLESAKGGQA